MVQNYYRPSTLADALAAAQNGAVIAAGCTDLFAASQSQTMQGPVLDITGLAALRGVSQSAAGWRIGAATSWADIIAAKLPAAFAGLKQAAREVGSVQIQTSATIGSNLCNASPAADG
ncbi:MAG: FAD binding domain-containing protein, partial [Rhodobacteraceae bacterium]|nr:FAD binding domain-containing protein [Paracoccaceae bacterium]